MSYTRSPNAWRGEEDFRGSLGYHRTEDLLADAADLLQNGRDDEALRLYDIVLDREPHNTEVWFNRGVLHHSRGDTTNAIVCYRRAMCHCRSHERARILYYLGMACDSEGLLAEAAGCYQRTLNMQPDNVEAHLGLAACYQRRGLLAEARNRYERVLSFAEDCAAAHYNLGLIHLEGERLDQAIEHFQNALNLEPRDADTMYNLGLTMQKKGLHGEAAQHFQQALDVTPDDAELYNLLGSCCKALGELEVAEACYRRAVELDIDYGSAWTNLAVTLHTRDEREEAAEAYRQALRLGHNPNSARYMLAALEGGCPQAPPQGYVTDLYDEYATDFEHSLLEKLHYNVPKLLGAEVEAIRPGSFAKVLDLGCGTGLVGEVLCGKAGQLIGVDLSAAMLAEAEKKGIYDQLRQVDIVQYLREDQENHDLIIAGDVLIYVGELSAFFREVAGCLSPDGLLAFSIETCQPGEGEYVLRSSGRYAHNPAHIEKQARHCGLAVRLSSSARIRKERGNWINGNIFVLSRVAA